jgi:hypothetical protein
MVRISESGKEAAWKAAAKHWHKRFRIRGRLAVASTHRCVCGFARRAGRNQLCSRPSARQFGGQQAGHKSLAPEDRRHAWQVAGRPRERLDRSKQKTSTARTRSSSLPTGSAFRSPPACGHSSRRRSAPSSAMTSRSDFLWTCWTRRERRFLPRRRTCGRTSATPTRTLLGRWRAEARSLVVKIPSVRLLHRAGRYRLQLVGSLSGDCGTGTGRPSFGYNGTSVYGFVLLGTA